MKTTIIQDDDKLTVNGYRISREGKNRLKMEGIRNTAKLEGTTKGRTLTLDSIIAHDGKELLDILVTLDSYLTITHQYPNVMIRGFAYQFLAEMVDIYAGME